MKIKVLDLEKVLILSSVGKNPFLKRLRV